MENKNVSQQNKNIGIDSTNNGTINSNSTNSNNPTNSDNNSTNISDEFREIFDNGEEISIDKLAKLEEPKVAPSATISEINKALDEVNIDNLTEEEQAALLLQESSRNFIAYDDVGYRENVDNITNKVQGNKPLHSKVLSFKKKVSKAKSALLKLKQASGLGSHVNIALWHSGFYVTIEPLTDEEIIKLELELTDELTRIGKLTHTLIYSNYSILFANIILKYFKKKIIATSLALDDDQDILDFIHINDIHTIATNMALSIYPSGFNAVIPCSNSAKTVDGKPKCSHKKNVKLDLSKLQWEDLTKLTPKHIQQMNKVLPSTVTVDEVIEYQKTLPYSGEIIETYKLPYEDGNELEIDVHIQAPNVTYYLEAGRDFITSLRKAANDIVKDSKQIKNPEEAENVLIKTYYLQLYLHYIKSIKIDDAILSSIDDIKEGLNTLTGNESIRDKLLKSIKDYIDNSLVSIVGIPNFICERCKQPQSKTEIIPLSPFEYFFILLHSRYERILQKYQKENKNEKGI